MRVIMWLIKHLIKNETIHLRECISNKEHNMLIFTP